MAAATSEAVPSTTMTNDANVAPIVNDKKRRRANDDAPLDSPTSPKQPKLSDGAKPSPAIPFVIGEAQCGDSDTGKVRLVRFELRPSDIELIKRSAEEYANYFDPEQQEREEEDEDLAMWKTNARFTFYPDYDEPVEIAAAATSVHHLEEAWMVKNDVKADDVWYDTSKLCPATSVYVRVLNDLVVQVAIIGGQVTLNMLIRAAEQVLDTPLSAEGLEGLVEEEDLTPLDGITRPATLGHLLQHTLLLDTTSLMRDEAPPQDVHFTANANECSRELQLTC